MRFHFVIPVLSALACTPILVLSGVSQAQTATATPSPVEVKVRLAQARDEVTISGLDLVFVGRNDTIRIGSESGRAVGSSMNSIALTSSRVSGGTLWTLADKPSGRIRHRLVGDSIEVRGDMLRVDMKPVPGLMTVHSLPGSTRLMDVVARMDLETYLLGVLPREMPADWPLEALKAQAVASRSFVLEKVRARRSSDGHRFHVESTILDQVFEWHDPSELQKNKLEKVRRALSETRDEVLADKRGEVITAYFHADCGGRTENASAVWGGQSATSGTAVDAGCPLSPRARWTWRVSGEELAMRLRATLGLSPLSRIRDVRADALSESGRILKLALVTDDGVERKLSGHQLRAVLGFDRLKSTAFEIRKSRDGGFQFEGRGHGHGVGLCQWGARWLAGRGADYRRILSHYYANANLVRAKLAP
ncbi:MAG: SpoIID/LytB domain-containing protein [Bdellovibrionaceae bacterium]|nr:SpoIID/LytB domain-containing protein [Pseudobdellovibrionaceae bacterium]